jgi:DNA-binding IscR family transcriptional regulator
LSEALDVPLRTVRSVLEALLRAGIVRPCGAEAAEGVQPARPLERIRVADVLAALRGPREVALAAPRLTQVVGEVLAEVDRATALAAEGRNLRDLVESLAPAVDRPSAAS